MPELKPCPVCEANGVKTMLAFNAPRCTSCDYVTPTGWIQKALSGPMFWVSAIVLITMVSCVARRMG